MNDSNIASECSEHKLLPYLAAICPYGSSNNIQGCNDFRILLFFLKADCYISQVFHPIIRTLIVIGTILNLFSLYCFLKMNKRNSQNVYLSVLSLGDTINLQINFTLPMLRQNERFDNYFRSSTVLCRIAGVLAEFFLIFPTWIVVLLTMERLICISWPLKRRSSYTQTRAKTSILILAILVLLLSIYRLFDLKGIDQASVFSVLACNGSYISVDFMRDLNLMIWTIVPECFTLIMSLIIIYQIKLATQKFQPNYSKARQLKYNQATKTVLLISILFLCFHTPTGILIALDLFYGRDDKTLGIVIILVSRKLTIVLYEISLCCKFFIYNQTFRNFKGILHTSIFRFTRRTNSAKLGRPVLANSHEHPQRRTIHFGPKKQSITSPISQTDSLMKNVEEHHNIVKTHPLQTRPTSLSRINREQHQTMTVIINKTHEPMHVSLSRTSDLLKQYSIDKRRPLILTGSQIAL
ncbi:unnamed protein product [Rotaria socialis]|uniref:G-protein coupled receptors family 1 profile domain-containing protein n=1 Tax=Rotaria socialis TaxID=392032 RepID=A0A818BVA6_9BILA|nr:unnamed protein product [Rotaria socialis]CAF3421123.1 unnamed protein product [Rotaria socialis]CAF3503607.1 unnamed protein product [Rotaria socialis]CAF4105483.1 unnamed protein product [Rotaria socialis]CAF4136463.1 unnamed protein product [Rotaria socialis]